MKVILLENVKALGKADDIVEVNDGYARNFLIRRKLALEASPQNLHEVKQRKHSQAAKAKRELEAAQALAEQLKDRTVVLRMKCGEGGKLYGAVTAMDIAEALKAEGFKLDKRGISLKQSIKQLGSYVAELKLHNEVSLSLNVKVEEQA